MPVAPVVRSNQRSRIRGLQAIAAGLGKVAQTLEDRRRRKFEEEQIRLERERQGRAEARADRGLDLEEGRLRQRQREVAARSDQDAAEAAREAAKEDAKTKNSITAARAAFKKAAGREPTKEEAADLEAFIRGNEGVLLNSYIRSFEPKAGGGSGGKGAESEREAARFISFYFSAENEPLRSLRRGEIRDSLDKINVGENQATFEQDLAKKIWETLVLREKGTSFGQGGDFNNLNDSAQLLAASRLAEEILWTEYGLKPDATREARIDEHLEIMRRTRGFRIPQPSIPPDYDPGITRIPGIDEGVGIPPESNTGQSAAERARALLRGPK